MARATAALSLIAVTVLSAPGFAQEHCDVEDLNAPCPLADGQTIQGTIRQQGGRNYYWFGAPVSNMHLHVALVDLPADYDLYIFSDQSSDPTRPFLQSANPELGPEVVDTVLADAGTYLLEVVSDPGQPFDANQPYTLLFGLAAPPPPTPTPLPPPPPTPTLEPARATVPPLISRGGGAAASDVYAAGLVPRLQQVDRFAAGGPGTVAAQDPPAGSAVSPGTVVDVFVATGDVEVPRVAGLPEQAALSLMHASGFRVDTRRTRSGTVPAGAAIGSPSAGQVLPSGAQVVLIVSQGE